MSPVRRGDALPIFNRIGVLRAERKMSRAQLAQLVDVNPQTVGALERGDHYPSLDLAFRICWVFDLPVEAVFSRTEFGPLSTEVYRNAPSTEVYRNAPSTEVYRNALSTEVYRNDRTTTEGSEKPSA